MHDQGIEARPPLGLEDPRHRDVGARIAAQPVDRFGREGDKLTVSQQAGGAGKARIIGGEAVCHLISGLPA